MGGAGVAPDGTWVTAGETVVGGILVGASGILSWANISDQVSAMNTEEETTPIPHRKMRKRTMYAKIVTALL
jgi:hypothetical protein